MTPLPSTSMGSFHLNTATPVIRPFSAHERNKVVTDSAQRKLERKRANARLRQQRCRARKRARARELGAKNLESKKPETTQGRVVEKKPVNAGVSATVKPDSGKFKTWQPPPAAKISTGPKKASVSKKQPWKQQHQSPMYHPSYYGQHHPHGGHYGQWFAAWSQQAAAYYGHPQQNYHYPHHPYQHPAVKPHHTAPERKLPPASPLQLVSPKSSDRRGTNAGEDSSGATTPYDEVEAMVKSPIRSFGVIRTPMGDDLQIGTYSPEHSILPPLWSTSTKHTPASSTAQSPWLGALPSPSLMTTTPAAGMTTNSSKQIPLSDNETPPPPSLPLQTPIKMSTEMEAWQNSSPTSHR